MYESYFESSLSSHTACQQCHLLAYLCLREVQTFCNRHTEKKCSLWHRLRCQYAFACFAGLPEHVHGIAYGTTHCRSDPLQEVIWRHDFC